MDLSDISDIADQVGGCVLTEAEFTPDESEFRARQAQKFGEASDYLAQMLGTDDALRAEAAEKFGDDVAGAAKWMLYESGRAAPGEGLRSAIAEAENCHATLAERALVERVNTANQRAVIQARLKARRRELAREKQHAAWDAAAAAAGIAIVPPTPTLETGAVGAALAAGQYDRTQTAYPELVFDDSALDIPPGAACATFGSYTDDDDVQQRAAEQASTLRARSTAASSDDAAPAPAPPALPAIVAPALDALRAAAPSAAALSAPPTATAALEGDEKLELEDGDSLD